MEIFFNERAADKNAAMDIVADSLIHGGYCSQEYGNALSDREAVSSTFIGHGIATPHGTPESRQYVKKTGVVFHYFREGVVWDEDGSRVFLVCGIASKDDSHLTILRQIMTLTEIDGFESKISRVATEKGLKNLLAATPAKSAQTSSQNFNLVAVTACPTGVAHTYMSADAIKAEAKKRGWNCKVETRGSVGVKDELTEDDIKKADLVIVAADIGVPTDRFAGKKMHKTSTGAALKQTKKVFDDAVSGSSAAEKTGLYQHLLTGISYMLPMVVAGGLIVALSFAAGGINRDGNFAQLLGNIGGIALGAMVPFLSAFIGFSIAGRPGIVPGFVGGAISVAINAGFLGGIASGYLAGYIILALTKYIKLPKSLEALKPILILPFLATLAAAVLMNYVIGMPIAWLMNHLTEFLNGMQTGNAVALGAIIGAMMCADLGGPINKVAYAFSVGLLSAQQYAPMAAAMAAGMVPPLAMGIATLIAKNKFEQDERESGKACLALGVCFISEGAIPFAAKDAIRVIPCCIAGGAVTGGTALAFGSKLMAPHGGVFTLLIPGAVTPVFMYLVSIAVGSVLAGVVYALIKPGKMGTLTITVQDKNGIHVRPSACFYQIVKKYGATVYVNDVKIDSISKMVSLNADYGDELTIRCNNQKFLEEIKQCKF